MLSNQLKFASWNVNSIKVRAPQVIEWMKTSKCDILFMQETKSLDENFPAQIFQENGLQTYLHGQKAYNGVAIASRVPLEDVRYGLPLLTESEQDDQARYIECDIKSSANQIITFGGLYMPNGNPVLNDDGSLHPKFTYKIDWMKRLYYHAQKLNEAGRPTILCGDFNIIPNQNDCWDISVWKGDALHHHQTLASYRTLLNLGYTDIWRAFHANKIAYSFWDYQGGAWQKDHGIRIDHIIANPEATDLFTACDIDKSPRNNDKASDHTPIWAEIKI